MARPVKEKESSSYWQKLEGEVQNNQSRVSMILGGLIILVVVVLIFNFFNKNKSSLGPAQNTENMQQQDVSAENLPGKYTVKEEDTLFTIAEKYYKDGFKYSEIVKANNLSSPDMIEVDQVLEIPKLETVTMVNESTPPTPTPTPAKSPQPISTPSSTDAPWGPKITQNSYTVLEGDWLSKIAGRAYGDIFSYDKIAKANNISNPDHIEPGMVLVIPR